MFCNQCGARLQPGVAYCTHCGKAVGAPGTPAATAGAPVVLPAAVGRVTKHRNILGILWVVAGVLSFPPALVLMGMSSMHFGHFYGWGGPFGPDFPQFLVPLFGFLGAGLFIYSLGSIATGVGLLASQTWARMLAIILGIIRLINIPFGTALGIYTLWVLLPEQSNLEYAQLCQQRVHI